MAAPPAGFALQPLDPEFKCTNCTGPLGKVFVFPCKHRICEACSTLAFVSCPTCDKAGIAALDAALSRTTQVVASRRLFQCLTCLQTVSKSEVDGHRRECVAPASLASAQSPAAANAATSAATSAAPNGSNDTVFGPLMQKLEARLPFLRAVEPKLKLRVVKEVYDQHGSAAHFEEFVEDVVMVAMQASIDINANPQPTAESTSRAAIATRQPGATASPELHPQLAVVQDLLANVQAMLPSPAAASTPAKQPPATGNYDIEASDESVNTSPQKSGRSHDGGLRRLVMGLVLQGTIADVKRDLKNQQYGVVVLDDGRSLAVHSRSSATKKLVEGQRVVFKCLPCHENPGTMVAAEVREVEMTKKPRHIGVVAELRTDKKGHQCGFITLTAGGGASVYVHESEAPPGTLVVGERVRFNIVPNHLRDDLPKAVDVVVEGDGSKSRDEAKTANSANADAAQPAPSTPPAPPRADGKLTGTVVTWQEQSQGGSFGFIRPDEGGDDVYLRHRDNPQIQFFVRLRVAFNKVPNPSHPGKSKALGVELLDQAVASATPSTPHAAPTNASTANTLMEGVVAKWQEDVHKKKCGHIAPSDGTPYVFAHESKALEPLECGDRVLFEKALDRDGVHYRALNIRKIHQSALSGAAASTSAPAAQVAWPSLTDVVSSQSKTASKGASTPSKHVVVAATPPARREVNEAASRPRSTDGGAGKGATRDDPPPSKEVFRGSVLRWERDKHGRYYGFIKPSTGELEVFVHEMDNNGKIAGMRQGARVTYRTVPLWYKEGQFKAVEVKVIGA